MSDDLQPYSDRRRAVHERERLDIGTITQIQRMGCEGATFDQIYHEFSRIGVTVEQIRRVLVPRDEEPGKTPRRQEKANTGFAKIKARLFRR